MTTLTRLVCLGLLTISTLAMTACGFALRGTHQTQIPPQGQQVVLVLQDDAQTFALKRPLQQKLALVGVTDANSGNQITVSNVRFRRYELVGTLTEVRLVLMADITYTLQKNGQTKKHNAPLQVERNYQHNEASVATLDQQGEKAKAWLYDNLAERIAEQYRMLAITP